MNARIGALGLAALLSTLPASALASSHMDAPLITLDDAANTTDVYAFVSGGGSANVTSGGPTKYLTAALAVYPFEEPGIGPNKYNFDDNVLYQIHVALGRDLAKGRPTLSYQFRFTTSYKNRNTILQSYLGVINDVDDAAQNLTQRYTITKVDHRTGRRTIIGRGVVPPNNQGIATPKYNQDGNGNNRAKDGVASADDLDPYTAQTVVSFPNGYQAFAGQRDDGFYADVLAVFDLLQLRGPGDAQDAQGGFNVHTMVLNIPMSELGGDRQQVGVYATTSRQRFTILFNDNDPATLGDFVQVGRQGNPLFCEALIAVKDKDRYNRTSPEQDAALFATYALNPELARLLNLLVLEPDIPGIETGRTDLAGIFIPDLIKVDLSTPAARLAGGGPAHPTNPDDPGFHRLGIFGGDVLPSTLAGGNVPGGWPNGRRFGDDVLDIAVTAIISDLRVSPPIIRGPASDNANTNDIAYNKVFPYAATALNGRNHGHHGVP